MTGFLKWAKEKVECTRLPCQISIMDFIQRRQINGFSRIVIEARPEGYVVNQWFAKGFGRSIDVTHRKLLETAHLWDAKSKLEEVTTCLELEGWEFDNEESYALYDVNDQLGQYQSKTIECLSAHEYLMKRAGQGRCQIRQLPKGFFCAMSIDPYGVVRLKRANEKAVVAPSSIAAMYENIIRVPGSRGFVAEGVFDGARFFTVDVLYFHNAWQSENIIASEYAWVSYAANSNVSNLHMLKQHEVNPHAIGALLNTNVNALMVYDQFGKVAISEYGARQVNVGGEPNTTLYDEHLKKIGTLRQPQELDLRYQLLTCLHLNTGNSGLEGVFF